MAQNKLYIICVGNAIPLIAKKTTEELNKRGQDI